MKVLDEARILAILNGEVQAENEQEQLMEACFVFGINGKELGTLLNQMADQVHFFDGVDWFYATLGYAKGQQLYNEENELVISHLLNNRTQ